MSTDKLNVGQLKEELEDYDDYVEVWVSRGGAAGHAHRVRHSIGGSFGEHVSIGK